MLGAVRGRLTYANVMAAFALFIALGSAGYAATQIPKNSVKAKQIAKNAVRSAEVAAGAIKGPEIRNRSLEAADVMPGEIPAGPPGPQGEQGTQGEQGLQGTRGASAPVVGAATGPTPPAAERFQPPVPVSLTAPTSGRVFVMGRDAVGIACTGTGTNGTIGIYLDGNPVPGTAHSLPDIPLEDLIEGGFGAVHYRATGLSGVVAPGAHQLQFGFACDGPAVTEEVASQAHHSLGGVLVGE